MIYQGKCLKVHLDVTKLWYVDIHEYMFSDMLHQEYTLSSLQNIYSNRDEQGFDMSTPAWSPNTLYYTPMDILGYAMSSQARRSRYTMSLSRK
jgi:hypothetical protein